MKNNILVAGGAGFIGINFVEYWSQNYKNDNIIVFDNLTYSSNKIFLSELIKKNKNIKFEKGNILNKNKVITLLKKYKINKIINFAAETHVDNSILDPKIFINTNILGTFVLLDSARKVWEKSKFKNTHFHQISTDEVYGSLKKNQKKFKEESKFNPSSPYSASKASSDLLVISFYKTYQMNVTISNTSNNFGPFINQEKLIPKIILNIINNKKIPIYGNGNQIREWIFVLDHIKGIEKILLKGKFGESYNLSSSYNISNIKLVKLICKIINSKFQNNNKYIKQYPRAILASKKNSEKLITFVDDRPGHDYKYGLNITKSKNKINFVPKSNFKKDISFTIDWFLNNKKYWNV